MLITSYTKFMTSEPLFQNTYILRRPGVASFSYIIKILTMFLETIFKYSRKVKRIRNYVSKCNLYVFLDIANSWFSVKRCWCQQNSRTMSRDSYILWTFFRSGTTGFRERGLFGPSHQWASPKKPILNRINLLLSLSLR